MNVKQREFEDDGGYLGDKLVGQRGMVHYRDVHWAQPASCQCVRVSLVTCQTKVDDRRRKT